MWTVKTKIFFILYRLTAAWLPISQRMSLAKKLRAFWAKRICKYTGKDINIERGALFSPELSLGNGSGIGIDCEVYGPVDIGDYVMMGPEVVIYTTGHKTDRTDMPMQQQGMLPRQAVHIGDDVWIGRRVIIMPGVTIGNGCIIGAGAIVTNDIPAYSVAVGVPARVVRNRKEKR